MKLTSIDIGNLTIMEPVTTLTDLIVAIVCFYAYRKLKEHPEKDKTAIKLYRYFFLTMSIATTFGALIGHAFLNYLSFEWKLPGWVISMISVALAERAAIIHARPLLKKHFGHFFVYLNIAELLTFIFLAMYSLKFIFVEIHAVYGLLVILFSFELFVYTRTKNEGSKLAMWSILFAFLAMICHLAKFSLHQWFNYLDMSHVLMAISSFVLYKGVGKMEIYK